MNLDPLSTAPFAEMALLLGITAAAGALAVRLRGLSKTRLPMAKSSRYGKTQWWLMPIIESQAIAQ